MESGGVGALSLKLVRAGGRKRPMHFSKLFALGALAMLIPGYLGVYKSYATPGNPYTISVQVTEFPGTHIALLVVGLVGLLILLPSLKRDPTAAQRSAAVLLAVLLGAFLAINAFDITQSSAQAGLAFYALCLGCLLALTAALSSKTA